MTRRRIALLLGLAALALPAAAPAQSIPCETAGTTSLETCELWVARYNNDTTFLDDIEADFGNDVVPSPDGARVYVTGRSWGGQSDYDAATVSYDATTGAERWTQRFDAARGYDYGAAVETSPDGSRVYTAVAGNRASGSIGRFDYIVLAHDAATGAVLWEGSFDAGRNQNDLPVALAVTPDGKSVVVTGYSQGLGPGIYDYATAVFEATDGSLRWVARYEGGVGDDTPAGLALAPDGSTAYVTGRSGVTGGSEGVTIAYDVASGAERWLSRFAGGVLSSIAAAPDGSRVVVAGAAAGTGSNTSDIIVISYEPASGALQWEQRFDGPTSNYDAPTSIGVAGGRVFVAGVTWNMIDDTVLYLFDADYVTLAFDASTGSPRWRRNYDYSGTDGVAVALGTSPDGSRVYVTGHSRGVPSVWKYATIAYDSSTGNEVWAARKGGLEGVWGEAKKLAVSGDGTRVYVTGAGMGTDWFDMLTVAYAG